jgi:Amt family ammonium transporter
MRMSAINTIWVLLGTALVFFMQAGFTMVETGFTRAKNSGNIIMKNILNLCIGSVVFWFLGFGFMFGSGNSIFGKIDFFILGDYTPFLSDGISKWTFVIFQTVFCITASTIVSGAMAERTKFSAYCIYSVVISLVIYPVAGHWVRGGGWLSSLGFHDFAGSSIVHMLGGVTAIVGAVMLGARIGKYTEDGKSKAIPGHSITLGALGVFILWFGWFGFNGCSALGIGNDMVTPGLIFMNTNLSAAMSVIITMLFTFYRYKKPDVSMTLNGALAGLVAITAGCDVVSQAGAAVIGACAGIVVVLVIEMVDNKFKLDDPVGAIGVHGACGALGTIMVGLFAKENGLFYGGGFHLLGVQFLGVISIGIWVALMAFLTFKTIDKTIGLRVSRREEIEGLDTSEHGLSNAYADFLPTVPVDSLVEEIDQVLGVLPIVNDIPVDVAIPIKKHAEINYGGAGSVLTKVDIITKQSKFEELKTAMNQIGVTGMTVTQVLGCGIQKGATEYYRGVPVDVQLLPKVRVEIVVAKVPVECVVATARKVLYTGHIGDGKIFIYDVRDAMKVRTGETGYDAMQGIEEKID